MRLSKEADNSLKLALNANYTDQVVSVGGNGGKVWEYVTVVVSASGNYVKMCVNTAYTPLSCKSTALSVNMPNISTDSTMVLLGGYDVEIYGAQIHMSPLSESDMQALSQQMQNVYYKTFFELGRIAAVTTQEYACLRRVKTENSGLIAKGKFYNQQQYQLAHNLYTVAVYLTVYSGDADLDITCPALSWLSHQLGSDSITLYYENYAGLGRDGEMCTVQVSGASDASASYNLSIELLYNIGGSGTQNGVS